MADPGSRASPPEDPHRRPRVLVVSPQPFFEERGTPLAVRQVVEALRQLGDRVDILTYPVGRDLNLRGVRIYRGPDPLGVKHVPIGFSFRKVVLDAALLPTLARRLRDSYDWIHAVEEAAFFTLPLARRRGIPLLYDMQSSLAEQLAELPGLRNRVARQWLQAMERWMLGEADVVVASRGLASRRPGHDIREWQFSSEVRRTESHRIRALERRHGIPPHAPLVLYTGSLAPYQGVSQLVRAIPSVRAAFPEVVFLVVGGTEGEARGLRREAASVGAADALRMVSRTAGDELDAYLARADVLASPRQYGSNLPLKVFDYLAAGRAILATDIPPHRTVLDDRLALLVEPGAEGIARGLETLLGDPERRGDLARAGREYAEKHLGWESFVRRVADVTAPLRAPMEAPMGRTEPRRQGEEGPSPLPSYVSARTGANEGIPDRNGMYPRHPAASVSRRSEP